MSDQTISAALQDCLDEVESGRSAEQALSMYPELRAEIEPLLVAALLVRDERPKPRSGFRADLQVALAAEVARNGAQPGKSRLGWSRRRLATRLGGALAGSVLALSLLVVASADSRPGEPLHIVRRGVERVSRETDRALHFAADAMRYGSSYGAGAAAGRAAKPRATATTPWRTAEALSADDASPGVLAPRPNQRQASQPRGDRVDEGTSDNVAAVFEATGDQAPADDGQLAPAPTAVADDQDFADASVDGEPESGVGAIAQDANIGQPTTQSEAAASASASQADEPGPAVPTPVPTVTSLPAQPVGEPPTPEPTAAPTQREPTREPPREPPPVPTRPERELSGVAGAVIGSQRRPVGGARVVAVPVSWLRERQGRPAVPQRWMSRTGADGRYRIVGLPPGRYLIALVLEPRASGVLWYANAREPEGAEVLSLEPGKVANGINFRLPVQPGR